MGNRKGGEISTIIQGKRKNFSIVLEQKNYASPKQLHVKNLIQDSLLEECESSQQIKLFKEMQI